MEDERNEASSTSSSLDLETTKEQQPYEWSLNNNVDPPPESVLQLWTEVAHGLDTSQTIVWKSAVESLEHASQSLSTSPDARRFVEKYLAQIMGILLAQWPNKIGPYERNCVSESLDKAVDIVVQDLNIQIQRNGECRLLPALTHILNRKKTYYMGGKAGTSVDHEVQKGLPEVRLKMITRFRQARGFSLLHTYMMQTIGTPAFPEVDTLRQILRATTAALLRSARSVEDTPPAQQQQQGGPNNQHHDEERVALLEKLEDDAIAVANAVKQSINEMSDEDLKKMPLDHQLNGLLQDLYYIFDLLMASHRSSALDYYAFWRDLALRLITSPSVPLKLFGWEQVNILINACAEHRPPPRSFIVSNAGCTFVNGKYDYAGPVTHDGYAKLEGPDNNVSRLRYVRNIPQEEGERGLYELRPWRNTVYFRFTPRGHKLTLFRCTMRSHQKWWFISEADKKQPGTDRDIDYYQHKCKDLDNVQALVPPPRGWVTCRKAGVDPAPQLDAQGCVVPLGEESNTLEHLLAKWAIDNSILDKLPRSTGRVSSAKVVEFSVTLSKFLARMYMSEHERNICRAAAAPEIEHDATSTAWISNVITFISSTQLLVSLLGLLSLLLRHWPKLCEAEQTNEIRRRFISLIASIRMGLFTFFNKAKETMVTLREVSRPSSPAPATTEEHQYESPESIWTAAANELDTTQTVACKSAGMALDSASKMLETNQAARLFVEKYMTTIIDILLSQDPCQLGPSERDYVSGSVAKAMDIVALDLGAQNRRNGECRLLPALTQVFDKSKPYYKSGKPDKFCLDHNGLPSQIRSSEIRPSEIRIKMFHRFRESHGCQLLHTYMLQRIGTPVFPKRDHLHHILTSMAHALQVQAPGAAVFPKTGPLHVLSSMADVLQVRTAAMRESSSVNQQIEEDVINICDAIMQSINNMTDAELNKKLVLTQVSVLVHDLQVLYDQLVSTRRSKTYAFYIFWRALALRLITNEALHIKITGWDMVKKLIQASMSHRPPPRSFLVTDAGCAVVNGKYDFVGPFMQDGFIKPNADITYVHRIPVGEEQGGREFTLCRCTIQGAAHQRWWFLSERNEKHNGTDCDIIDYYQHMSEKHEEAVPPSRGWVTCRSSGVDPPPHLQAEGCMVPFGEESNTLEHLLAKWAIDNDIADKLPCTSGRAPAAAKVVEYSVALTRFLAHMYKSEQERSLRLISAIPRRAVIENVATSTPPLSSDQPSSTIAASSRKRSLSDDGDEDWHFGQVLNDGPQLIIVDGAGTPEVNGVYYQDGYFENACKYFREGRWKNSDFRYYIFQCCVSNNTKHWYISIIPYGGHPGTSSDIDFYSAPVTNECQHIPPPRGWVKAPEGQESPPQLSYRATQQSQDGNNTVESQDGDEDDEITE